jgi:hypothetical protein
MNGDDTIPDIRTPSGPPDADLVTAQLLGEESAEPATMEIAERMVQQRPDLRAAVAGRLFVHGLLRSSAEAGGAARQHRVERVVAALSSAPAGGRTVRAWFAKPALIAAGAILAVGLSWAFLAGGPGRDGRSSFSLPEASAAEIVARAGEKAAGEDADLEYRITVYNDETNVKLRESALYLRGARWAMRTGNTWMGSDGSAAGDWMVLPPARELPKVGAGPNLKKFRPAEQFRNMLEFELHQVRVAGLMEDLGKSYKLETVGRKLRTIARDPAISRPDKSEKADRRFTHIRGEHPGLPLRRMDVWVEDGDGVPVVVELRTERRAGFPARRLVYELVGRGTRPDGFYRESFHKAPARPAAAAEKSAT